MNEPSQENGTEKITVDVPPLIKASKGGFRKGAGRPKKNQLTPEVVEAIDHPRKNIPMPSIDKSRLGNASKYSLQAVPPGPYTTKSQMWAAVFALQNINIERTTLGIRPFTDAEVTKYTGILAVEIERTLQSDDYKKFRISKSAGLAQQTIADIVPSLRVAMVEFMAQLKIMKKCDGCGRVGQPDMKKLHEGLQFVVYAMDKFGLPKIDTTLAENSDEMDIKQVIEEAQALVKEIITWPNLAPQRIIGALINPGTTGQVNKTIETPKPPEGDSNHRPDEVIHTVRLPNPPVSESEEILGDDIKQPPGQDGLVDGGLYAGGTGETPDIQDTEERNIMDFRGEERQDTTGFGAEV